MIQTPDCGLTFKDLIIDESVASVEQKFVDEAVSLVPSKNLI